MPKPLLFVRTRQACGALGLALACSTGWAAAEGSGFQGDVGGMLTHSASPAAGVAAANTALPYVYGDWGRFYGRVDTFGVRTVAWGQGHLEAAVRVSTEGWSAADSAHPRAGDRAAPTPIGLGTFQRTALGGLFAYLMHDPRSGGQFAELTWALRSTVGPVQLFPQLGLQYRSARYVNHLYGLNAAQAGATGLSAYSAGASLVPQVSLHASVPLSGPWALQLQARHRWLDDAIAHSPLMARSAQNSALIALTYSLP